MPEPIAFYFDFRSPYAYLAISQLPGIAGRARRQIRYRPVDVLSLMAKVGNRPTSIECPAKRRYVAADLRRWLQLYQVGMTPAPRAAESASALLLGGAVAAGARGGEEAYARIVFDAVWLHGAVLTSPEDLRRVLADAGFGDAEAVSQQASLQGAALASVEEEAVAAGVFGVPSFVADGELFFGNDRLDHLARAIAS